jgi:hypothetical protein
MNRAEVPGTFGILKWGRGAPLPQALLLLDE